MNLSFISLPIAALMSIGPWSVQVHASAAPPSSLAFVSKRLPESADGITIISTTRVQFENHHRIHSMHHSAQLLLPKGLPNNKFIYTGRRCSTQLCATIDDDGIMQLQTNTNELIERLELNQQFERWRFMQKLLEGELPASDIENVLLSTLHAYLQHGPTASSSNNKNENGGNASPVLTEQQRNTMDELIGKMVFVSDGIGDSRFLHMLVLPPVDYESIQIDTDDNDSTPEKGVVVVDHNALSILEQIEQLLPDPVEDEEAFKSAWDVVIDLYGRESVRVREEALQREKEGNMIVVDFDNNESKFNAENLQWRTLCAVGRVLLHFDFLTKGVLKKGTFD